MLAPTLMIQGTASSVGKSLLVTALCRLFRQDGIDVAPFKSQNMALNSAVTVDGFEIGRAQAVQAEAAGLRPCVEMNPILLKPEGHARSQVVVCGRPVGSLSAAEYHEYKPELAAIVADALSTLRRRHELVIIEGAGSPAEINLKDRDIVNMHVARIADAPVVLAGDIDRGGVFAAFVGTLELLEPDERKRVAAFVINKFRGDAGLLRPGLDFLERRTKKPVLGVIPFLEDLRIADEDSLSLDGRSARRRPAPGKLDIAVVRLPHISNFDDFVPLEHEPRVSLRFVRDASDVADADLVILPGSKLTVSDLAWLRASGIAAAIERRARDGGLVLGICGGFQMLGRWIDDPEATESREPHVAGLGLLDTSTLFRTSKTTAEVRVRVVTPCFLTADMGTAELVAYEIHMGEIVGGDDAAPFQLLSRNGEATDVVDGAISERGNVVGTLLHGLFENAALRTSLLGHLEARKGAPERPPEPIPSSSDEYDRVAATVRDSLDTELLYRLARVAPRPRSKPPLRAT